MSHGDVRPTKSNYRGGSWGGSTVRYYDDEGRGESKNLWEWFCEYYNGTRGGRYSATTAALLSLLPGAKFSPSLAHLLEMPEQDAYACIKFTVSRYGLYDIAVKWSNAEESRARQLVIKDLGEAAWVEFHAYLVACYSKVIEKIEREQHEAAERQRGEWAVYEAQRKAQQAIVDREDFELTDGNARLSLGQFESELATAVSSVDTYTYGGGDSIDDVVEVISDGSGWIEESSKAKGVKLQISLSLDMSNSMVYNGVAMQAATAFRDIGWMMKLLKQNNPDDLNIAFFTFSRDIGWSDKVSNYGKLVTELTAKPIEPGSTSIQEFSEFRESYLRNNVRSLFDGHDTYVAPLFEAIQNWENENGDPGAVRLDIILTDAVLEHPGDIRDADAIQERRNGNLRSVMLNFMPESDWLGSTLPKRTFMVKVDAENISGMLRNILSEFLVSI